MGPTVRLSGARAVPIRRPPPGPWCCRLRFPLSQGVRSLCGVLLVLGAPSLSYKVHLRVPPHTAPRTSLLFVLNGSGHISSLPVAPQGMGHLCSLPSPHRDRPQPFSTRQGSPHFSASVPRPAQFLQDVKIKISILGKYLMFNVHFLFCEKAI